MVEENFSKYALLKHNKFCQIFKQYLQEDFNKKNILIFIY